jgi:hypothetical protein
MANVTPPASAASCVTLGLPAAAGAAVGEVGGVGLVPPAVAEPLTPRETESLPAVKVTLPAKLPTVVGRNRTVTV